ncbi:hypothetical protein N1851_027760 [Merluccius polli]|uniref:Uncharacterized protein n=1 Tax=Merluccius polli TaxID=89951 RepID=A0AA47M9W2_MERPO|nr:hypothetical protein N1851_027760 [Merluccius polli]
MATEREQSDNQDDMSTATEERDGQQVAVSKASEKRVRKRREEEEEEEELASVPEGPSDSEESLFSGLEDSGSDSEDEDDEEDEDDDDDDGEGGAPTQEKDEKMGSGGDEGEERGMTEKERGLLVDKVDEYDHDSSDEEVGSHAHCKDDDEDDEDDDDEDDDEEDEEDDVGHIYSDPT